jgi:hypothetical protein
VNLVPVFGSIWLHHDSRQSRNTSSVRCCVVKTSRANYIFDGLFDVDANSTAAFGIFIGHGYA